MPSPLAIKDQSLASVITGPTDQRKATGAV